MRSVLYAIYALQTIPFIAASVVTTIMFVRMGGWSSILSDPFLLTGLPAYPLFIGLLSYCGIYSVSRRIPLSVLFLHYTLLTVFSSVCIFYIVLGTLLQYPDLACVEGSFPGIRCNYGWTSYVLQMLLYNPICIFLLMLVAVTGTLSQFKNDSST